MTKILSKTNSQVNKRNKQNNKNKTKPGQRKLRRSLGPRNKKRSYVSSPVVRTKAGSQVAMTKWMVKA
jgi:hypothetical protein